MSYYHEFQPRTDFGVEPDDRADPFMSAIGDIALAFAELEEAIEQQVTMLLNVPQDTGRIIVTPMMFPQRLNMLRALVPPDIAAEGCSDPNEAHARVLELIAKCRQAQQLRDYVLSPAWVGRTKVSATLEEDGLSVDTQEIGLVWLQDATDFILYLADEVERLALHLGLADEIIPEGNYRLRYCVRVNEMQVADRFVFDRMPAIILE